jgi:hypothetical protein
MGRLREVEHRILPPIAWPTSNVQFGNGRSTRDWATWTPALVAVEIRIVRCPEAPILSPLAQSWLAREMYRRTPQPQLVVKILRFTARRGAKGELRIPGTQYLIASGKPGCRLAKVRLGSSDRQRAESRSGREIGIVSPELRTLPRQGHPRRAIASKSPLPPQLVVKIFRSTARRGAKGGA